MENCPVTEEMMNAFDALFLECGCAGNCGCGDKNTTNVMGNIARRGLNQMSGDKKVALSKKALKKSQV